MSASYPGAAVDNGTSYSYSYLTMSRGVTWFPVYEYAATLADAFGVDLLAGPYVGTLPWLDLRDDNPAKKVALLRAAVDQALRLDAEGWALADASKDVAAAADWSAVARWNRGRADACKSGAYIPREVGA